MPESFDFGSRILYAESQHEAVGYQTTSEDGIAESAQQMGSGDGLAPHIAERVIESPPLPYPIAELESDKRLDSILEAAFEILREERHREGDLSVESDHRNPLPAAKKEQTSTNRRSQRAGGEEVMASEVIFGSCGRASHRDGQLGTMAYTETSTKISAKPVDTKMIRIVFGIVLAEIVIVESSVQLYLSGTYYVGACGLEERILVGGLSRLSFVLS